MRVFKNLVGLAIWMCACPGVMLAQSRIGPEKCVMCHKVQYDSWKDSKHAKMAAPVDCEACHGPGSEYRPIQIMKNPDAARKAGLLIPTKKECSACHGKGKVSPYTPELYAKVHAHKVKKD